MSNNNYPKNHNELSLSRVKLKTPGVCAGLFFLAVLLYLSGFSTVMLSLYVMINHSHQNFGAFEALGVLSGLSGAAIGVGFIIVGLLVHVLSLIGARLDWIYQLQKYQVQLQMHQ